MAYEIAEAQATVINEQLADKEELIRGIAQRWVEYCVLPQETRAELTEWGDRVVSDASALPYEDILRVYDVMDQIAPAVHAEAQSRFSARREELARQAADEAARVAEQRLGGVTWRAAARLERIQAQQ